jgi:hypothetical protein
MPDATTGDALDLTRCVAFAVQNAHLDLQFPCDFEQVARHLGLTVVGDEHYDRNAATRWGQVPKPKTVPIPEQGKTTRAKKAGAGTVTAKKKHHAMTKSANKDVVASKPALLQVQKKKAPPHATGQQYADAEAMDFQEDVVQKHLQRLDDSPVEGVQSVTNNQPVVASMSNYFSGGRDIQFDMPPHGWGMDVGTHDHQTPVTPHDIYSADNPVYNFNAYPCLSQGSTGFSPQNYGSVPPMDPSLSDPWVLQQLEAIERFDYSQYQAGLKQTEQYNFLDYPKPDESVLGNSIDAYLESLSQVSWH